MALPSLHVESFRDYMMNVRSPNTAKKYAEGALKFLGFLAQNGVRFDRMPPNILSLFSEYLVHRRMSPSSVVVYVAAAKRFLQWSKNRGDTNIELSAQLDLPKITKKLPNALHQDHLRAFIALASKEPEPKRSALLLLPFCGLRTGELLSLTVQSLTRVQAAVDKSNPSKKTEFLCLEVRGKGGDMRVVPLLPDGAPILVSYLRNWRRHVPGKWLFVYEDGHRISDRTLRHAASQIRKKIGLKRFTLHTLRRTYLSTLQRAGVDVATLTKIAGHNSFQTTMSYYLEINPEDLASTVGRTGARLMERSDYSARVDAATVDALAYLKNRKPGDLE